MTESTPIVMQGKIEGKWLNRLAEDLGWKPASDMVVAAGADVVGRGQPTVSLPGA